MRICKIVRGAGLSIIEAHAEGRQCVGSAESLWPCCEPSPVRPELTMVARMSTWPVYSMRCACVAVGCLSRRPVDERSAQPTNQSV